MSAALLDVSPATDRQALFDAWCDAEGELEDAYRTWREAEPSWRADRSAAYVAALDREQQAAQVLASHAGVVA